MSTSARGCWDPGELGRHSEARRIARTDKEAQAIVDDVQKRYKRASFDELAKKYSDDPNTKEKGGQFPLLRPEDRR